MVVVAGVTLTLDIEMILLYESGECPLEDAIAKLAQDLRSLPGTLSDLKAGGFITDYGIFGQDQMVTPVYYSYDWTPPGFEGVMKMVGHEVYMTSQCDRLSLGGAA